MCFVGAIFIGGLLFGRATKRVKREYKSRWIFSDFLDIFNLNCVYAKITKIQYLSHKMIKITAAEINYRLSDVFNVVVLNYSQMF